MMNGFLRDPPYGLWVLLKHTGFTVVAVEALALPAGPRRSVRNE